MGLQRPWAHIHIATTSRHRGSQMNDLSSALRTFATANPFSTLEESGRVLSTLLSNLAREDTPKFRRVNLTNAKIKAAVLGAAGACEVLIAAGFLAVEDGSALEMTGDSASARAAAASAALDEALVAAGGPFALRQRLAHESRCCWRRPRRGWHGAHRRHGQPGQGLANRAAAAGRRGALASLRRA